MKIICCAVIALYIFLAGCADSPDKISASYVSPLQYQSYNCNQLALELNRIQSRLVEVIGVQEEASSDDALVTGLGLVLFWPSLFFLEGSTGREAELGRLKGEIDAIEQAAIRSNCQDTAQYIAESKKRAKEKKESKENEQ